jgi:hypothetical protein
MWLVVERKQWLKKLDGNFRCRWTEKMDKWMKFFVVYLYMTDTYFLQKLVTKVKPNINYLMRFIRNWVIMVIQWMVRWSCNVIKKMP